MLSGRFADTTTAVHVAPHGCTQLLKLWALTQLLHLGYTGRFMPVARQTARLPLQLFTCHLSSLGLQTWQLMGAGR